MQVHIEPTSISNVMIVGNKVRERKHYDITEKVNKVLLHYKFVKLFYGEKESYMICVGDRVTIDSQETIVKNEQDLKNILKHLQAGNVISMANPKAYK